MSKYNGEKVFAWTAERVKEKFPQEGFISAIKFSDADLIDPQNGVFLDRDKAEADEGFKQLIPYCVFVHDRNILNYTRGKSGGESRLHAKISVGVGGHINPTEQISSDFYMESLLREMREEIEGFDEAWKQSEIIGVLNDNSNDVGKVHLGVVHIFNLKHENITAKEDCLANLTFTPIEELNGPLFDRLEGWSQLVVKRFANNLLMK